MQRRKSYDYGQSRPGWVGMTEVELIETDSGPQWSGGVGPGYSLNMPYRGNPEYRLGSGPHKGHGPKGYRRSDQRIRDEIIELLTENEWLDAGNIEVQVNSGEATLTGAVDSRRSKRLAEAIADSVAGVEDVHNELKIGSQEQAGPIKSEKAAPGTPSAEYRKRIAESGTAEPGRAPGLPSANLESQLKRGMCVEGLHGNKIGEIKEIREGDFLVNRPVARDVYVPFSAVRQVAHDRVTLNVPADAVDNMDWRHAPLIGEPPPVIGTMEERGK